MSRSEASPMAALSRTGRALPSIESVRSFVVAPIRAAAFWTAIALPVVYLPMLVTGAGWEQPLLLLALLVLNVAAFVVGHDHNRPDGPERHA
ncbi:MAG: hypothetical protein ABEH90_07850 [Halolamina sp.]